MRTMAAGDIERAIAFWRGIPGMGLSAADEQEAVAAFLRLNEDMCFIEEDGSGALIGTSLCGCDGRRGYLYHVAVAPAHRGAGLGARLVEASLEALRRRGVTKCHLFVFRDNAEGARFWRHTGWTLREDISVFSRTP